MLQLPDPLWFRVGAFWLEACLCQCGCHFIPVLTSPLPVYSTNTVQKPSKININTSIYLSVCCLSIIKSVIPSMYLPICSVVCSILLSYQSICPRHSFCPSICRSFVQTIYLSVNLSRYHSVYLSFRLSVSFHTSIRFWGLFAYDRKRLGHDLK